jgi:hypothetical protein
LENGTDVAEFSESSLSIDLTRIGAICEEEWQAFLSDMDAIPVPQKQDPRAFLRPPVTRWQSPESGWSLLSPFHSKTPRSSDIVSELPRRS